MKRDVSNTDSAKGAFMKKYVPPKSGLIISPERKAAFFNGLALYISEYKRRMQRKAEPHVPESKAS